LEVLRLHTGFPDKIRFGQIPFGVVQLGPLKSLPLVSEAIGVVSFIDKAEYPSNLREDLATRGALQAGIGASQRGMANGATQQR